MELPMAVLVFGILLAICLYGLAISSRRAARNDASRTSMPRQQTVSPADQRSGVARAADRTFEG